MDSALDQADKHSHV